MEVSFSCCRPAEKAIVHRSRTSNSDQCHSSHTPRRIQANFKGDGAVIPRDRRGTAKAEIRSARKGERRDTQRRSARDVQDHQRQERRRREGIGNLTGWTLTRPETATASELANIRFRLCKVNRRAASTRRLRRCKWRHSRGGCCADNRAVLAFRKTSFRPCGV